MQYVAIVVSLGVTALAFAVFADAVARMVRVIRLGQPAPGLTSNPGARTATLFREFLGHTRMAKRPLVAAAHWFVMIGFGALVFTLITAYGQIFDAHYALPVIGHWIPFEWFTEAIAWLTLLGIVALILIRQRFHPRSEGR
ncbi:MAG TPA: Fe-S oxidoreductase, partial [Jiangellaceae bacterium]|nr:Fe-S oxidoreductase [Jiangellaceae bacterium]